MLQQARLENALRILPGSLIAKLNRAAERIERQRARKATKRRSSAAAEAPAPESICAFRRIRTASP
jgi:hypothetical protein